MTHKTRIRIAAAVTGLFLAGLTAAGIASRHDGVGQPASTTTQTATTPAPARPAVASAPPAQPVSSRAPGTRSEPHEVDDDEDRGRGRGGHEDEGEEEPDD